MKKIKRAAALVLLAAILLSLAACAPASPPVTPSLTPTPTALPSPTPAPESTPAATARPDTKPLLWEVRDEKSGSRLWLFGSIHEADSALYPLPEAVMNAYEGSDALAVEMDILVLAGNLARQIAMLRGMRCPDGKTFKDAVSQETYEAVTKLAKERGFYASYLEGYNSAFWNLLISDETSSVAGLDSSLGVDMRLLTLAHGSGKEVLEVESFELQLSLLTLGSEELQEAMLLSAARYFNESSELLKELYSAYRRGDEEKLTELLTADGELEFEGLSTEDAARLEAELEAYDLAMIDDRNLGMAEKAKAYMSEGKEVFFVVGEAHMLGEKGIAGLLRDAGYTVKKIDY